jgi:flagellar motor component MotA
MNTRRVIALIAVVGFVVRGILHGTPLFIFVDAPALLIVFGLTALGDLGAHSSAQRRAAFRALRDSFRSEPDQTLDAQSALHAHAYFCRMGELALGAGALGVLIGLISLFSGFDDPTHIGPALATALLALFWGLFLSELLFRDAAASCASHALSPGVLSEKETS